MTNREKPVTVAPAGSRKEQELRERDAEFGPSFRVRFEGEPECTADDFGHTGKLVSVKYIHEPGEYDEDDEVQDDE